jgi:Fur family ferric uptake transcriptional regulator
VSRITDELTTILKQHGHSVTKQRLLVFELLLDREPMSMHELVARAAGRLDRASVYRIVNLFEHIGVVQRINIGWKYKLELSDKFAEHHHHLTCLNCHSVTSIGGDKLEELINKLATEHRFRVLEHQIELQGLCAQCQQKTPHS